MNKSTFLAFIRFAYNFVPSHTYTLNRIATMVTQENSNDGLQKDLYSVAVLRHINRKFIATRDAFTPDQWAEVEKIALAAVEQYRTNYEMTLPEKPINDALKKSREENDI